MNTRTPLSNDHLRRILKPIVRYFIQKSLTYKSFCLLAKDLFVEVAQEEVLKTSTKVNASRLAAITGLNRNDVTAVLDRGMQTETPLHLHDRIIAQWENDRRFQGKSGRPRVLTYDGEDSEFADLISRVSTHLHPGTLLFELERAGIVAREGAKIRLIKYEHDTPADIGETFSLMASDIEGILIAADENMNRTHSVKNLHLRTEFDNIYRSDLPHLRSWILKEGRAFHKKVRSYLARFDQDIAPRAKSEPAGGHIAVTAVGLILSESDRISEK